MKGKDSSQKLNEITRELNRLTEEVNSFSSFKTGNYDGCGTRFSHPVQILEFLLMSAFLIPVWGGLDWLLLLINWTKRKCYKDKALLYSI